MKLAGPLFAERDSLLCSERQAEGSVSILLKSWGKDNKVMWGSSITYEDYPVEEALRLMRDLGFTRVEMWKDHLKRCKTEKLRQAFGKFARESLGLEMGALNAGGALLPPLWN